MGERGRKKKQAHYNERLQEVHCQTQGGPEGFFNGSRDRILGIPLQSEQNQMDFL